VRLLNGSGVSREAPAPFCERLAGKFRRSTHPLFGCLKGRGFHFEDTHITGRERIKKLMVLLAIAFSWAHRTGEWRNEQSPIKIKKHGRPAISLFRYGLDFLCNALANVFYKPDLLKNSYQFISHMDILYGF
jgi:hypothetical protein